MVDPNTSLSDLRIRLILNSLATASTFSGAMTLLLKGNIAAAWMFGMFVFCLCGFVLSCIDYSNFLRKRDD